MDEETLARCEQLVAALTAMSPTRRRSHYSMCLKRAKDARSRRDNDYARVLELEAELCESIGMPR